MTSLPRLAGTKPVQPLVLLYPAKLWFGSQRRTFTRLTALHLHSRSPLIHSSTRRLATTLKSISAPLIDPQSRQISKPSTEVPSVEPAASNSQRGVLSILPRSWVPYAELMRIEKPGGLWGFYFPYLIGLGYAACIHPALEPTTILTTGGLLLAWNVILRGAACTINDNFDRDYDRQVARCRNRPIARGAVKPLQGHVFYAGQTMIAAGTVALLPHAADCFHHAPAILFLLSIYPLAKRVTDFPQLVLCIPLAWGILMSCSALGVDPFTVQQGTMAAATWSLVASNALWLMMLDYVNACQDTIDDLKAGVRSMAVRYQNTAKFITVLGIAQTSLMLTAGYLAGLGPIYFIISCGGNASFIAWMAQTVDRTRPETCAWWFKNGSLIVGGVSVAGLFGEYTWNRFEESSLARKEDHLADVTI
ncbi:MAG: hypothetical protein LQ340_001560 [Diploschistes diacapsis]|nr:MAG: hypothetical protein LQ340_001560 [Diploschistes diacapsis]